MGDRLDIEKTILDVLGPGDETRNGCGLVVLGPQILEQSPDYDFDALVSDLAPFDLVI